MTQDALKAELNAQAKLDVLISSAKQKLNLAKDSEITRYLPADGGGYIHHFAFARLKRDNPEQLRQIIQKHIIDIQEPQLVPGKERSPRGSQKQRRGAIEFSKSELKRLANLLRSSGDADLMRKVLEHQNSFQEAQKGLLASVRTGKLQPELWDAYSAACKVKGISPTPVDSE